MTPKAGEIWVIKNPKVSEYEINGKKVMRSNKGHSLIINIVEKEVYYEYTSDDKYNIKELLHCHVNAFLYCYVSSGMSLLRYKIDKIKANL
jgi:hypothetical protein